MKASFSGRAVIRIYEFYFVWPDILKCQPESYPETYEHDEFLFINAGCPRKNAIDLKSSNGNFFIFIIKRLFLFKSLISRINFHIFSSIFGDLTVTLKISKLQNSSFVKTRAAALPIVSYVKL